MQSSSIFEYVAFGDVGSQSAFRSTVHKTAPIYEQVFLSVFSADGKSVAHGVLDGNELIWKVEKLEGK